MQRFCGADLCALVAEDALRPVFPLAGFLVDLHIHGADAQAFAAADAFAFVTVDTQQGEIAHGLEEHRDGTQVFTERPVIALSHAAKKLVRLIYALEKSKRPYSTAA